MPSVAISEKADVLGGILAHVNETDLFSPCHDFSGFGLGHHASAQPVGSVLGSHAERHAYVIGHIMRVFASQGCSMSTKAGTHGNGIVFVDKGLHLIVGVYLIAGFDGFVY